MQDLLVLVQGQRSYIVKFWVNDGSSLLIRKLSHLSVPLVDNLLRLMQAYSYLVVFKLVTVILKKGKEQIH